MRENAYGGEICRGDGDEIIKKKSTPTIHSHITKLIFSKTGTPCLFQKAVYEDKRTCNRNRMTLTSTQREAWD